MKKVIFLAIIIIASGFGLVLTQHMYVMDKNHSRLGFSATHLGISHVDGNFKNFEAKLNFSKEDLSDAVIEMTAEAKSIDTDVEMRDNDLRSSNFFDVTKYPTIEFKSTSFKKMEANKYTLAGNITIHGVTKPITFDVTYNGKIVHPMSKKNVMGFTLTGKLNRKDFHVGSGATSLAIGDEIELSSNVEFIDSGLSL